MIVALQTIPNSLETRLGMPRPDWAVIWDWIDANVHADHLHEAWSDIACQWLRALQSTMTVNYDVWESDNFMLLSSTDAKAANRLLRCCEYDREAILQSLPGVAKDDGYGKHIVLAFHDVDTYYDYISDFYPDAGEFGGSSGMCINQGYVHIATCCRGPDLEHVLAHELVHAVLAHLPLPLWLNEGVTQVIEQSVTDRSSFAMNSELRRRHRAYWTAESIHAFWSGDSFYQSDEGQELSYSLAEVLFRNLVSDYRGKALEFINQASYSDAGDSALIKSCGVGLAERAAQFLGAGAWQPRADYSQPDRNG